MIDSKFADCDDAEECEKEECLYCGFHMTSPCEYPPPGPCSKAMEIAYFEDQQREK